MLPNSLSPFGLGIGFLSQAVATKEGIPELLFNIASGDRLKLLSEIASKRQRMTALSKTIDASVAEGSRHLKRLSDANRSVHGLPLPLNPLFSSYSMSASFHILSNTPAFLHSWNLSWTVLEAPSDLGRAFH